MNAPAGPTIFALSSGPPPAAIAVVRVSGPSAGPALDRLAGARPAPRRATVRTLCDGDGQPLDRGLVLWLPGPGTATGDDMAEFHLHGGRAVVAAVLAALGSMPGLQPAAPGAFTRRALETGRIDLTAAEGLGDLLAAETEAQRRAAWRVAEGGLGRLIAGWTTRLLWIAARVEAAIEFAEEQDGVPADPAVAEGMAALAAEWRAALAHPPAERLRDGVRVVIAGPVNAGKSSLLNVLVGRDVAIALPQPGTTRDLIEVPVSLGGLPLLVIDSAGLREADDPAERIGVARAEAALAEADLVLWLGMPGDCPPVRHAIRIQAMADLPGRDRPTDGADLAVSARSGTGLDALRRLLVERTAALAPTGDVFALNQRHRRLLDEAANALEAAQRADDDLILAEQLRHARSQLDLITGAGGVENMLDALFAGFCIGK